MRTSDRHDLLRRRSFGICRQAKWSMTSEAKSSRVSTSFRSPLISRSMAAPRYCRIRSICWMPDMQTKFVESNGLRFEVLEQGTGVRLALCLRCSFISGAGIWCRQEMACSGKPCRQSANLTPVPCSSTSKRSPLASTNLVCISGIQHIDLIRQYRGAGIDLLINGDRNDGETRVLFASDVMLHFA